MSQIPRVVIVGAGIGGLSFAIALKRQLGFENFTIFEKAFSVGGTWRDNVYPGCASDVGIHFYSLSTDLKSDWTCSHPFQPEVESYWQNLSQLYSLQSHICFGTKVEKAVWDPSANLYHVTTKDTKTGERTTTDAEVLVSAIGLLDTPKYPEIPGLATFRGTLFHSARWERDFDFKGKRVAVIGNGASATQFIPIIVKTPAIQVTQFCRTPNWIFPPVRKWYSPRMIWAFKHIPFVKRSLRLLQYLGSELNYFVIFKFDTTRRAISKSLTDYMRDAAPEKYHAQLTPSYPLGCKRVIFDTDYFSTLHQPNMTLNWDGIASISASGILTSKGEDLPFDAIILATGYCADNYPLAIQGLEGQTIQEYFASRGGPTAYLGTSVPGFPNFHMIGGPNTATGHTSFIFTEEVQVNYVIQLIRPILEQKLSVIDVTMKATDAYNAELQNRLSRSVFPQCTSWYRVGGTGKVTSIFPGPVALFWWWLRSPAWNHYDIVSYNGP